MRTCTIQLLQAVNWCTYWFYSILNFPQYSKRFCWRHCQRFYCVYVYHLHLSACKFPIVMIMRYRCPCLVCRHPISDQLIWRNVRPIKKTSYGLLCLEFTWNVDMIKDCMFSLDSCELVDYWNWAHAFLNFHLILHDLPSSLRTE